MKIGELVTTETAAERLGYDVKYFRNNWPKLLLGIKPIKLGIHRSIRFNWNDIESLLLQPK